MSSHIAPIPAPEGYVANFEDPEKMGDVVGYWVFGVGMVLSFSFLCMRTYTKIFVARNFAIEDGKLYILCMLLESGILLILALRL